MTNINTNLRNELEKQYKEGQELHFGRYEFTIKPEITPSKKDKEICCLNSKSKPMCDIEIFPMQMGMTNSIFNIDNSFTLPVVGCNKPLKELPKKINNTIYKQPSKEWYKYIGSNNTTAIYYCENEQIIFCLLEIILNGTANFNFFNATTGFFKLIKDNKRCIINGKHCQIYSSHPNGNIDFSLNNINTNAASWIDFFQKVWNLSKLRAIAILAKICNLSLSSLFKPTSNNTEKLNTAYIPENFSSGTETFTLLIKKEIYGFNGEIIGGVAMYGNSNQTFCVPCQAVKNELTIGQQGQSAYFINQHLMEKHKNATIFLCQDMRLAIAIQKALDEIRVYNQDELIITAHLGEDIKIFPWECFFGHDVIFIPAPHPKYMARAEEYSKICQGVHVSSFKVSKFFFLHSPLGDPDFNLGQLTEAEKGLLANVVVMPECDNPVAALRKCAKDAMPLKEYMALGMQNGLFKIDRAIAAETADTNKQLCLPPPAKEQLPKPPSSLKGVILQDIYRPGIYIIIVGAKGAGKTLLGLSGIRCLLNKNASLPFFPSNGADNGNICLVDGETPHDEFSENLKRFDLDNELNKRLFILSIFGDDLPEFCDEFSLKSEIFREGLKRYCLTNQCRYIVIDNLLSLTGNEPSGCSHIVLQWIMDLQRAGITTILVHHRDTREDKARSSQDYVNKARVWIHLVGRDEILDNERVPLAAREKAKENGLTLGIKYNAVKSASILDGMTYWFHLFFGTPDWELLSVTDRIGEEISLEPLSPSKPQIVKEAKEAEKNAHTKPSNDGLSPSEREVYNIIVGAGGSSTRKDIQEKWGAGENKTQKTLNSLIDKGLIFKKGSGPNTYYVIAN